jgi:hypothetical protein
MDIPAKLTPFSQSILHPALESSLNRLARGKPASLAFRSELLTHPQQVRALLAEHALAEWGGSPPELGRLLGTEPPRGDVRGKAGQGTKRAQALLKDFPQAYGRLRRWSEWVFTSEWSQAQLLQVMEEIEPMAAEALSWVHALAVAAVGSYDRLGALLEKKEKDPARANSLRLGLVAGLETPDSLLLQALAVGASPSEFRSRFGHMPMAIEGEIAHPRLENLPDEALTHPGFEVWNWDVGQAQNRRQEAEEKAIAQAGMLGRSGVRKIIELTQQALMSHAQAREALAYVLAAARHWAMAAAAEGAGDGRIHQPDEIFMLEIEEIKQMMTGEWHSRGHVESLIQERKQAFEAEPADDWRHDHCRAWPVTTPPGNCCS